MTTSGQVCGERRREVRTDGDTKGCGAGERAEVAALRGTAGMVDGADHAEVWGSLGLARDREAHPPRRADDQQPHVTVLRKSA
jgi:hypothetical protein